MRAAHDHEIVGVTREAQAGLCQALVEQVEDDVRQKRRNDPALRSAGRGGAELQALHHARREKLPNEAQDIAVRDTLGNAIEDEVMGDVIEEGLDVGIHDPLEPGGVSRTEDLNRLMSVAARTEAKGELREMRLEDGFKDGANHLLSDAVSDSGDAQRTKRRRGVVATFAFPFRNEDPSQGRGAVASAFEGAHQGGEIVVQIGFKSANADLIHASRAAIAFDGKKSAAHPVGVNQPGQGVEFRQLVGQKTFLTVWRCCEAQGQSRRGVPEPSGVFSTSSGCPNKPGGRDRGVTFGGSIP